MKETEDKLEMLSAGVETEEERVRTLQEELAQHSRDAATLELTLTTVAGQLRAASELLRQLEREHSVWEIDVSAPML